MSESTNKRLKTALAYAERGWPIHPLKGKKPILKDWPNKASTDPKTIRSWWRKRPSANIGIVTRRCIVIDIDVKDGRDGEQSLQKLQSALGPLPETYEVQTPNGRHLYFKHPAQPIPNSVGRTGEGIDIRVDNAYVVAPPSVVDGQTYKIIADRPLIDLPDTWIAHLVAEQLSSSLAIDEGTRDDTLFREACRLRSKNYPFDQAEEMLIQINAVRCNPPLDRKQVRKCLKSAFRYRPGYEPNDLGNAQRLLDAVDGRLIYVPDLSSFFLFDGYRWIEDLHDLISLGLLKKSNRRIIQEASLIESEKLRKQRENFGISAQNTPRLKAALESAKSEPDVVVRLDKLNADPHLLGVENGVIDLRTGRFQKSDKDDLITKSAGCRYVKAATCPRWRRFLRQALNSDKELVSYLRRVIGYCLTATTSEQVFFAILGPAATGKSTFLEIIAELFGDYGANIRTEVLMANLRSKGGASEDEARLVGVRFLTTNETSEGSRFNQALIKDLTGGDRITARFLYKSSFEFRTEFKLFIRGNHRPRFDGEDTGMARRIRLIPFTNQVEDKRRDPTLMRKLRDELPGILNWAIAGCLQWQSDGLREPKVVLDATSDYISEMDIFGAFLRECCQLDDDHRVTFASLYTAYLRWCKSKSHKPKTRNAIAEMLAIRGFRDTRFRVDKKLVRGRLGLRIKPRRIKRAADRNS